MALLSDKKWWLNFKWFMLVIIIMMIIGVSIGYIDIITHGYDGVDGSMLDPSTFLFTVAGYSIKLIVAVFTAFICIGFMRYIDNKTGGTWEQNMTSIESNPMATAVYRGMLALAVFGLFAMILSS